MDRDATGGVVVQPVTMGDHIRSGPHVCSSRGVSRWDRSRKEVLALPANCWIEEESGEVVVVAEDDEGRV